MVTRITGIPDEKGIIRISCGTDMIEIYVPPSGGSGGPGQKGFVIDMPHAAYYPGLRKKIFPFDTPHVLAEAPAFLYMPGRGGPKGKIDIDAIVGRIEAHVATPHLRNPEAVVIHHQGAIDVHSVSRLSKRLSKSLPGAELAVTFGARPKGG